MNISEAAQRSGLPAKTLRYYEDIALVTPTRRSNGYRDYSARDVHKLRFLLRARGLGFSVSECRSLLSLYEDRDRSSADVKNLTVTRIAAIDCKLRELHAMRAVLSALVESCEGDDRPDCPILDDLAGNGSAEAATAVASDAERPRIALPNRRALRASAAIKSTREHTRLTTRSAAERVAATTLVRESRETT